MGHAQMKHATRMALSRAHPPMPLSLSLSLSLRWISVCPYQNVSIVDFIGAIMEVTTSGILVQKIILVFI